MWPIKNFLFLRITNQKERKKKKREKKEKKDDQI